jgi:putative acetyltransferase
MNVAIRPETESDHTVIFEVTRRAFAGKPYSDGTEPHIVDGLRNANALTLSLVAQLGDQIVGHVAFSPAISAKGTMGWYALGPLSVHPTVQRSGIGSSLVLAGLNALNDMAAAGCVLVGNPTYYVRFGFVNAPRLAPNGEPGEYYCVKLLRGKMPDEPLGFHPAFYSDGKGTPGA